MSQISVKNLTFGYDGGYENIFENASFTLDTDWKLGFCGRNGRGKTTFLKLLLGSLIYSGSISSSVEFIYFPFNVANKEQNCIEIVGDDWKLYREISLMGMDSELLYRPFNTLSNGEQTRILLASLFCDDNKFLLIDEPTNHLDIDARLTVANYLNTKKGFIVVSHDRAFLDSCTDHTLSINRANIEIIKGNFSVWHENKCRQDEFELAENEKLKKDIKRLKQSAIQKASWADTAESRKIGFNPRFTEKTQGRRAFEGAKAKANMKRVKAIEKRQNAAIDEKESLLKNLEKSDSLKIQTLSFHSERLVEFTDVSLCYDNRCILSDLNFVIKSGDRLALKGRNGSGKTSIIKMILSNAVSSGNDIAHSGNIYRANGLIISYVNQSTELLDNPDKTAGSRWSFCDYEAQNELDPTLFRAILRKLDFSRLHFEMAINSFSEGQKKKLLIAKSLAAPAHLYIWDEPLNYIDLLSRMQIEELIIQYKPTMLFVEHDRFFCEKIATGIINL